LIQLSVPYHIIFTVRQYTFVNLLSNKCTILQVVYILLPSILRGENAFSFGVFGTGRGTDERETKPGLRVSWRQTYKVVAYK
jgi:hypothetical protein